MPEKPLLTIGEIAACARALASDPYSLTERARHWAKIGLLKPAAQVGEGSGRHALFPESEAYMVAVICALADAGLQPAGSRVVADVQNAARFTLAKWLRRPGPCFVEIFFYPGGKTLTEVHDGTPKAKHPNAQGKERARISIKLDLDLLFSGVSEALAARAGGIDK